MASEWDDEMVRQAAIEVAGSIDALLQVGEAQGDDVAVRARDRVREAHAAYLRATGEARSRMAARPPAQSPGC